MRRTRRVLSGLAALALAACMAVPAAGGLTAGASGTITINSDDDAEHTYTAYQILTGTTVEVEGKEHLASIDWGSNINGQALMDDTDGKVAALFGLAPTSAADFADKIATYVGDDDTDGARAKEIAQFIANYITGDGTVVQSGETSVEDGYYLIKDAINESGEPSGDTLSLHMLQVIGKDTEFSTKKSKPTFEKKLKDAADTTGDVTGWQDGADYDIGDTVPFQLKATLPDDYDAYTKYTMTFNDDLGINDSEPFTISPDGFSPKVYIDIDGDGAYSEDADLLLLQEFYTLATDDLATSGKFTITITDLKSVDLDGKTVVPGTTNVIVEYEAVLNDNAVIGSKGNWNEAYLTYSNNPNYSGEGDSDEDTTEETPHDKVVVFTYQATFNKIDPELSGDDKSLKGAGFTLYKQYKGEVSGKENKAAELEKPGTEFWYEVGTFKNTDGNQTTFEFKGLDDGTYLLRETKTPDGYTTMEDVEFDITATHDDEGDAPTLIELKGADKNIDGGIILGVADGVLSADIENKEGTVLPGTGGIGTTIFYVVGGMLVVGAGVLLIARKRTQKEEQ